MFGSHQLLYFIEIYTAVSYGWQIELRLDGTTQAKCAESFTSQHVLGLICMKIETHTLNNNLSTRLGLQQPNPLEFMHVMDKVNLSAGFSSYRAQKKMKG